MKITYSKGVITIDVNDRIEVANFIFGRSDGLELVKFHMGELFNQRQAQKEHEEKETLLKKMTPQEIRDILARKEK